VASERFTPGRGLISRRGLVAGASFASTAAFSIQTEANELSDGRFRDELIELILNERPQLHPVKGRDLQTIKLGNAEVYLGNIFATVKELPKPERRKALLNFVDTFIATSVKKLDLPLDQALVRLRAQIAPAAYVKQFPSMVHSPLTTEVVIASVLDQESSYRFVTDADLKSWALKEYTVRQHAVSNLDHEASKIPIQVRALGAGDGRFVLFEETDGYTAARILCPKFVSRIHHALGGKIYFAIPNRDFLAAWSENFAAKEQFATLATQDSMSQNHPLTAEILVSEGGKLRAANAIERAAHGRS
jgi:uncharacterized protein YtpQ (UPF0354 family)